VETRGKREERGPRRGQQPHCRSCESINQSINHILLLHKPFNKHCVDTRTQTKAINSHKHNQKDPPLPVTSSQSGGESVPFSPQITHFSDCIQMTLLRFLPDTTDEQHSFYSVPMVWYIYRTIFNRDLAALMDSKRQGIDKM